MIIEWKKWIVNDKCDIDDNGELKYGVDAWWIILDMNEMVINLSTNENVNMMFKWSDISNIDWLLYLKV